MNRALHAVDTLNSQQIPFDVADLRPLENASKEKFKVVSLFSGCGGMDLGFKGGFEFLGRRYDANPFDLIWANDLNAAAVRSYRKNVGNDVHLGDIWELLDKIPTDADVVVGGFPCQDISVNGKGLGVDGSRSGLYRAMVKVVERIKPRVFVAENVKGLLNANNRDSLRRVISDFSALGYEVTYNLYNAADFGVPQARERVIIVGTAPGVTKFQPPSRVLERSQWVTARDAIHDLEHLPIDQAFSHIWSEAKRSPEQGNRKLRADRAAQTIRAECHGNIQWHYSLERRISMREAARIQSFPDEFIFDAKLRETERQIGNAVPPVLAWHIANSVKALLSK